MQPITQAHTQSAKSRTNGLLLGASPKQSLEWWVKSNMVLENGFHTFERKLCKNFKHEGKTWHALNNIQQIKKCPKYSWYLGCHKFYRHL